MSRNSPNCVYHSQFLALHSGESFMKVQSKVIKLQMFENLQKSANETVIFSFTFLCKFSQVFLIGHESNKEVTALHCLFLIWFIIHLKWWFSSFRLHQIFPILMVQMLFSKIQQAPGPDFRKVGKSLLLQIDS